MFKHLSSLVLASTVFASSLACLPAAHAADETPWLVRIRATHMQTANRSSAFPTLNANSQDAVEVNDKTFPELDVTYFFTPHWAAELALTYPQEHEVTLRDNTGNSSNVGTFKHTPPILSLQYHFDTVKGFKPYLGVGINYTRISDVNLASGVKTEDSSWGPAVGAGLDYRLTDNVSLNLDVKKVMVRSDVFAANGTKIGDVKVDPVLFSVGLGWRF